MKTLRPFRRPREGSALLLVLWLVVVMTLVATVTARISRLDGSVSQLSSERIRCRWAARAGVETAIGLLLADERSTDTLMDLWSDNSDELEDVEQDGCTWTAEVTDESGKLDINSATADQLGALDLMTPDLLDGILDWRDTDDSPRANGAEEGYYISLAHGYSCRNGSFETIRELLRVRGMEADSLTGSDDLTAMGYVPLADLLTCYAAQTNLDGDGEARINVNRAGASSLKQNLSLPDAQVKWIQSHRSFGTLADLTDANKKASTSGNSSNNGNSGRTSSNTSSRTSSSTSSASSRSSTSATGSRTSSSANSRTSTSKGGSSSSGNNNNQSQDTGKPLSVSTLAEVADRICLNTRTPVAGRLNLNTASEEVLEAFFEGDRQLAQALVAAREGRPNGFESFDEVRAVDGMTDATFKKWIDHMALRSSVFRIVSTATSQATGQTLRIEAVINRDLDSGRVLYWRED